MGRSRYKIVDPKLPHLLQGTKLFGAARNDQSLLLNAEVGMHSHAGAWERGKTLHALHGNK